MTSQLTDIEFPKFTSLPQEIRLMIWKLSLPGPRTVHIRQRPLTTPCHRKLKAWQQRQRRKGKNVSLHKSDFKVDWQSPAGIYSDGATAPGIAFVCREAYAVVCDRFARVFRLQDSRESLREIWLDGGGDVLFIRHDLFHWDRDVKGLDAVMCGVQSMTDLRTVENLAILLHLDESAVVGRNFLIGVYWNEEMLAQILAVFGGVRRLILVFECYDHWSHLWRRKLRLLEQAGDRVAYDKLLVSSGLRRRRRNEIKARALQEELEFIEPINVHATIKRYRDFDPSSNTSGMGVEVPSPVEDLNFKTMGISVAKIKEEKKTGLMMPSVEFKVAVSKRLREELEEAKRDCEKRIQEFGNGVCEGL